MWNLAFDSLLNRFEKGPVKCIGFADDAALLITGICPNTMVDVMQGALSKAVEWGNDSKLTFGAAKTVAVLFSRRNKPIIPHKLKVDGAEIEFSNSVKYLGLTLDKKLNYGIHINDKLRKAKGTLFNLNSALGNAFGPKPLLMRWAYLSIVRPMLSYAAIAWAKEAHRFTKKFERLQRLAATCFCNTKRSTPTLALELLYDLQPLDLHIKAQALNSYIRIQGRNKPGWDGVGKKLGRSGHLTWCKKELALAGITNLTSDVSPIQYNWDNEFLVDQDSFKEGAPVKPPGLSCYTDGSLMDQKVGWGVVISGEGPDVTLNGSLDSRCSVFQAEITAIHQAAARLVEIQAESVTFFVDSQAALLALDKTVSSSHSVKECVNSLNLLGTKMKVTLRWVKAHVGHQLNEVADELAKAGGDRLDNLIQAKLPKRVFQNLINSKLDKLWKARWKSSPGMWQSKIWISGPDRKTALGLLKLNRKDLSCCIQAITGHNHLMYHQVKCRLKTDPICRLCNEEDETAWHLISACPVLRCPRADIFLSYAMCEQPDWSPGQLNRFLKVPSMVELMGRS